MLALSSVLILMLFNIDKIIRGLSIAGLPVAGLSKDAAVARLEEETKNFLDQKINLAYRDKTWPAKIKNLGVVFDPEKTAAKAYGLGREKNVFKAIKNQIAAALGIIRLTPDFNIDQAVLEEFIKEGLAEIEKPARNASLIYNKAKRDFDIEKPAEGIIVDRRRLIAEIEKQASGLNPADIVLSLEKEEPIVYEDGIETARKKALDILSAAPFILKFEKKKLYLQKDDLLNLFEFIPEDTMPKKTLGLAISGEKLNYFLTSLAPVINRTPINAELTVKNGRAAIFQLAENGVELNAEKNVGPISNAILASQNEIDLIVDTVQPAITQNTIENLGILNFLGSGSSNFAGSSAARVNNIRISAYKFHGLLIKPDEEFSFTSLLGPIGAEEGYLPGLVIKTDKIIPEYGGGICQVSTTMFRAAINAGLKITERYPHSFPVAFYDPQGFDATVYPPHPDLRFINDTPAHILIQTKIKGNVLTFEVYGTKDREVKIIGPKEYDQKPDGSMKAEFTREIYQDGKLARSKTFYSNYKSPKLFPEEKNPLE